MKAQRDIEWQAVQGYCWEAAAGWGEHACSASAAQNSCWQWPQAGRSALRQACWLCSAAACWDQGTLHA